MPYPIPGYPLLQTSRPQGTSMQLAAGNIDIRDIQPGLLAALQAVAQAIGQRITIFSGYRTSAYSASVGGFAGDPHTRGIAVDAYVGSVPIGNIPAATRLFPKYGLVTGNQPNFYHGTPDPPHVQMATTSSTGGSASTPTGQKADPWELAVLRALHAPVTYRNLSFLSWWHRYEGGTASNNWLNTTQPATGATSYNSQGVKNYPTAAIGVQATVETLTNGRYTSIVGALRSGDPWAYGNRNTIASNLRTWGSKDFATMWSSGQVAPGAAPGTDTSLGAAIAATPGSVASHIPGVSEIKSIADLFNWLGNNWDRVLEVIGGSALLIVGLLLLGKQMVGSARGSDIGQLADALKQNARQRSADARRREDEALYDETKRGNEQQRQKDRATIRRNRRTPSRAQVPAAVGQTDDVPY